MIEHMIGIIGSLASITGFSLRDLVRFNKKKRHGKLLIQTVVRYLAAFDRKDDGFLGNWSLEKLDYSYERHSNWYVTGNLSVLYPLESRNRWQCQMFLEYRKFHSGLSVFPANGWIAHKLWLCVSGVYDVVLERQLNGKIEGQCSMIQVEPKRHVKDQAKLYNGRLDGNRLIWEAENTNTKGKGTFVFFMRKRWKDFTPFADE